MSAEKIIELLESIGLIAGLAVFPQHVAALAIQPGKTGWIVARVEGTSERDKLKAARELAEMCGVKIGDALPKNPGWYVQWSGRTDWQPIDEASAKLLAQTIVAAGDRVIHVDGPLPAQSEAEKRTAAQRVKLLKNFIK